MKLRYSKLALLIIGTYSFQSIGDTIINGGSSQTINSAFTDRTITVGKDTGGTLNIDTGGIVSTNHMGIGLSGSEGTVNIVNGGQLNIEGERYAQPLDIGGSTDGSGTTPGGTGILTISGNGSTVNFSSAVRSPVNVGKNGGNGIVSVTDGGKFIINSSDGMWIGSRADKGNVATQSGYVSIDGTGSELISSGRIIVGTYSRGTLSVTNGGYVHTGARLDVGNQPETNAFDNLLFIDGTGSEVSAEESVQVGLQGKGTAVVSNGGTLRTDTIFVANGAGSNGELAVGAREGDSSAAAGNIDASVITFGKGNGRITLNHTDSDFLLSSDITGTGVINAFNGTTRLAGNNAAYSGDINISSPATIIVSHQNNLGDNNIINDGELRIQNDTDWVFTNPLSGSGMLTADTGNNHFSFNSPAPGTMFSGTVNLLNTLFDLSDINTGALAQSVLLLGQGSHTTVGTGEQRIGSLAFNGGTLIFGNINPGDAASREWITTSDSLDLTGTGQIQISSSGVFNNPPPVPAASVPLLQQDDGGVMIQLANSQGSVSGNAGNLTLVDQNNNVISDDTRVSVVQNGEVVANGIYDYRLTSGENNDGLYINYGLTQVELLAQGANALTLSAEGNSGNAADLSAQITGSGDLRINTDTPLSLSNSANSYTGTTRLDAGTLKMGNNNVLGNTHLLTLAQNTQLDMNGFAQTLQNLSSAEGSLIDFNQGALTVNNGTMAGNLTGAGSLTVTGGSLSISSDNTGMTADTTIDEDGSVYMQATHALGSGSVSNSGNLVIGTDSADNNRPLPTGYQVGSLTNSGTVVVTHLAAGTQFQVNGNYTGQDGLIQFDTVLEGDNSLTDKMTVTGDTSGQTFVSVNNIGGHGDQTINGIELISISGDSAGEFIKQGRIVAGTYDYSLVRGTGSRAGNWYLTSENTDVDPGTDPDADKNNRPEGGSYTANLAAANTMFNTRLHDRLGETQYTDALTGEEKVTGMWVRQVGGHNNWRDNSGQLKTQSNRYVIQMGGDIARWSTDGLDRWHLGIMTGYGHDSSRTRSSATGYSSKGSVNGYSVGTYATWYANDTDHSGLYADTWLQYSWFNNDVNGEGLASESYRSRGLTASAETGYTQKLTEFSGSKGSRNEWFIQPQAQITLMDVRADDHRENNGTRVEGKGNGNIQTRLGIRTYLKGHTREDDGKGREFQPFIEANWIHNTRNFSAGMDGVSLSQKGTKNLGEVKVGVEGQINPHLNLWGNVGVQVGDNGYNDSAAMLGIKYNF